MQISGAGGAGVASWPTGAGALPGAIKAPSLATMLINQTLGGLVQAGGTASVSLAAFAGAGGKGGLIDVMA